MRYVDYIVFANSDLDAVRTLIISYRLYEKPVWLLANLSFRCAPQTNFAYLQTSHLLLQLHTRH